MPLVHEVRAAIEEIIANRITLLKEMAQQQNEESFILAATQVAICGTPEALDAICDQIANAPNEQYRDILVGTLITFAPQKNRASYRARLEEMFKGDPAEIANIEESFAEMEEKFHPEILALDSVMNEFLNRLQRIIQEPEN